MKGKLELEIMPNDLKNKIYEFIEELTENEIKKIINNEAKNLVIKEINNILEPLVLKTLTQENFELNYGYFRNKEPIDNKIKNLIINYLDEPTYLYSKNSNKPSEKYHTSNSSDKSRLERMLIYSIEKYFDEHIEKKMDILINRHLKNKKELEKISEKKLKKLLFKKGEIK